jgi:hypothetical protein
LYCALAKDAQTQKNTPTESRPKIEWRRLDMERDIKNKSLATCQRCYHRTRKVLPTKTSKPNGVAKGVAKKRGKHHKEKRVTPLLGVTR